MDILTSTPSRGQWAELCGFLGKWWYKPDYQALRIILSAGIAHYEFKQPPVWFLLIGPSGSGKTSMAIEMLSYLPDVQLLDSPTIASFLSGFQENQGLLNRMSKIPGSVKNKHGILAYSDFSTVLHMPAEKRNELVSIHRRIYDGGYSKPVGNKEDLKWKGKCTVIAACTPEVDNYYGVWGALGQRFMEVRWPLDMDRIKYAELARKQLPFKKEIDKEFRERVQKYISGTLKHTDIEVPEDIISKLDNLAVFVARMRANVPKQHFGMAQVVTGDEAEEAPTRISMSLIQIALASAKLARVPKVRNVDYKLAVRVASDSIPFKRWRILNYLPVGENSYSEAISTKNLREATRQVKYEFHSALMDLESARLIEVEEDSEDNEEKMVWLSDEARHLLINSGVATVGLVPYRLANR